MTADHNDLFISRVIDASPAIVWRAWSEPEHFERWWAPKPVKTKVIAMDLRAGGGFRTVMTLPDGAEIDSHGCFLEVVPQKRLVFTDAVSAGWRPNKSPFMTAIIELSAKGGGTEYAATVLHNNAEDRQKHLDMGFEGGWGTALAQLNEIAASLAKG